MLGRAVVVAQPTETTAYTTVVTSRKSELIFSCLVFAATPAKIRLGFGNMTRPCATDTVACAVNGLPYWTSTRLPRVFRARNEKAQSGGQGAICTSDTRIFRVRALNTACLVLKLVCRVFMELLPSRQTLSDSTPQRGVCSICTVPRRNMQHFDRSLL